MTFTPTHRHYKGGLYQLVTLAHHSETMESMAVYKNADGVHWVRPLAMFQEVLPDGRWRFEALPERTYESKLHAVKARRAATGEGLREAMAWADDNRHLWDMAGSLQHTNQE